MSRAALWRQEASLKERERQANETFQNALEEGRNRSQKGLVPLRDTTTFNLNPMLLGNISKSAYFLKCCHQIKDWSALVDEIYYHVTHLEPWTPGAAKTTSTAFCLLLRLFTIRCTENQMKLMLDHVDSPYIRCIGFLYLRYAADPGIIWKSFQPYLYDQESVKIRANVNSKDSTVGDFVRGLLTDLEFYGTRLPRLPVGIEKEIKVKLLREEEIEQRAQRHFSDSKVMEYFEKVGSRVQAMYGDEENEVAWYDAVVDRILRKDDETGLQFYRPKFIVTFPEYGNTEVVSLGEMDMPGVVDHTPVFPSGSKGGDARRGSSSDYRSYDEYRHDSRYNYREKVESSPGYGRRKQDSYGVRGYRRDDSRGEIRNRDKHRYNDDDRHLSTRHCRSRSRSRDRSVPDEKELSRADNRRDRDNKATIDDFNHAQRDPIVVPTKTQTKSENMKKEEIEPKPATKTPEQLAALAEKKLKEYTNTMNLLASYYCYKLL